MMQAVPNACLFWDAFRGPGVGYFQRLTRGPFNCLACNSTQNTENALSFLIAYCRLIRSLKMWLCWLIDAV